MPLQYSTQASAVMASEDKSSLQYSFSHIPSSKVPVPKFKHKYGSVPRTSHHFMNSSVPNWFVSVPSHASSGLVSVRNYPVKNKVSALSKEKIKSHTAQAVDLLDQPRPTSDTWRRSCRRGTEQLEYQAPLRLQEHLCGIHFRPIVGCQGHRCRRRYIGPYACHYCQFS